MGASPAPSTPGTSPPGPTNAPWYAGNLQAAVLWVGQVVSHLGDALFHVGIFFLALEISGSKTTAGNFMALNFLPALVLGVFSGAIVDAFPRERIMLLADLLRAAAVGAIPILLANGNLTTGALAVAVLLRSTGATFFTPAIKAHLPDILPSHKLVGGVSWFQISEHLALIAGPLLAEWVVRDNDDIHLFSVDAGTFLFSAVCIAVLPLARAWVRRGDRRPARHEMRDTTHSLPDRRSKGRPGTPPRGVSWVYRHTVEGLREIWRQRDIRTLMLLITLDNFLIMGLAHVATPLLVDEVLSLGVGAYASALKFFFMGMAVASLLFWKVGRHLPKGKTIMWGLILDGITFIPFAYCQTLEQVKWAMFVHALTIPMIVIPRTVLIQQRLSGLSWAGPFPF